MDFSDLYDKETIAGEHASLYDEEDDGIFASASIMHLEYDQLVELMPKLSRALKPGGVLYVSFKYGDNDGYLGKRYYTYMTEERFAELAATVPELNVTQVGTFGNEHPGQPDFRWLWALLRKGEV